MNNLDLSTLTTAQLKALAWELRGTSAVQPIYQELGSRPWRVHIAAEDPNWNEKVAQALQEPIAHD